eukprot:1190988-Prorocentrum_minimum.AAC.4
MWPVRLHVRVSSTCTFTSCPTRDSSPSKNVSRFPPFRPITCVGILGLTPSTSTSCTIGHLIVPLCRGSVGTRRVRGGVHGVEPNLADQRHGRLKLLLCLAWESHDGVSADSSVGHVVPDGVDDAAITLVRVSAQHLLQNIVVARLERNVVERHHLRHLRASLDEALGKVAGVGGGEADALDAWHVVHVLQQVGEGPQAPSGAVLGEAWEVAAVGVDVLAKEGHLLVALLAELLHLRADRFGGARLLHPARLWHHAVCALLVAAVDDVDPGGGFGVAARRGDVLQDLDCLGLAHLLAQIHLL